ncbi:hypothetical protein ASPWEDRAFT_678861 [Aspergillus wentii DTO 134E9]|uniref:Uncharacterized protein n=1 Tax=Aspergillus wentii DTO 134E9 TaxID=1073089 RepID=A0A1L9R841_ASPWE|nr:uncharacterized protein ASPWEDRAFT_678861 [Aspergillus wentii DTO 134E9]OJJ31081.1 hypothetical protein ASPWEDRAFT_678861 [Aspergillus wentii DTO 134E9]
MSDDTALILGYRTNFLLLFPSLLFFFLARLGGSYFFCLKSIAYRNVLYILRRKVRLSSLYLKLERL